MSGLPKGGALLAYVAALIVTVAVCVSIYLDPPGANRARNLDQRRMMGLSALQIAISSYYRGHAALPPDLAALDRNAGLTTRTNWKDPVTGEAYAYEITGAASFRLCATFDRAAEGSDGGFFYARSHGAGRVCFEHTENPADAHTNAFHVPLPAEP